MNYQAEAVRNTGKPFHRKYKIPEIRLYIQDIEAGNLNADLILIGKVIEVNLTRDLSFITVHLDRGATISFRCETGNIMADSEQKMFIHSAEKRNIILKIYRHR